MAKSGWARADWVMRWVHSYTGLFLVPWLLVYGASAFCLNHGPWINKTFNIGPLQWDMVREETFVPEPGFPQTPEAQAQAIVDHLELGGFCRVQGKPTPSRMIIIRPSGSGNYRITWQRQDKLLVVEKQPFSAYRLMHSLHFRGGYRQRYFAQITWAVIVDIVSISLWLWAISGVYIWFRRRRQGWAGGVALATGFGLFTVLVVMLCL